MAVLAVGLSVTVAGGILVRRYRTGVDSIRRWRPDAHHLSTLLIGSVAFALSMIPFLASGRLGILGADINPDPVRHFAWTYLMYEAGTAQIWDHVESWYPFGPHALTAVSLHVWPS
ncbi:MAG TPA: hypothetical protein VNJ04_07130, partial [Gemmatimonadaceae bacterium]|nr:hypothetical protein [Gemmatimonadaceae bacterium]